MARVRGEGPPKKDDWTAWERAYTVTHAASGATEPVPDDEYLFLNNKYQVSVGIFEAVQGTEMFHLSIKRLDKEPIHDWRDLQRIKNEIVGPEHEGVELYPAESRMVDEANQFHLFVLADPEQRWPFGYFGDRLVGTAKEAERIGAKQRPLKQVTYNDMGVIHYCMDKEK